MEKNSKERDSDNRSTNTPTGQRTDVSLCSKNRPPHSSTPCTPARPIITVTKRKLSQIEGTISGGITRMSEDTAIVKNGQEKIRSSVANLTSTVTHLVLNHRKLTSGLIRKNQHFDEFVEQLNTEFLPPIKEIESVKQDTWNLLHGQATHKDNLNRLQATVDKLQGDVNELKKGQAELRLELTLSNRKSSHMEMMIERILHKVDGIGAKLDDQYRTMNQVNVQPAQNLQILTPTITQQPTRPLHIPLMPHQMSPPLMERQVPPPATLLPLKITPSPVLLIQEGRQPKRKTSSSPLTSSESDDNGLEDNGMDDNETANGSDVEYHPNTKSSRVSPARKIWTRGKSVRRGESVAVAPLQAKSKINTRARQPPPPITSHIGAGAGSSSRAVSPTTDSITSYRNLRSGLKAKRKRRY